MRSGDLTGSVLFVALSLIALATTARADQGTVQLVQRNGPFVVTVFTAPAPLRAGPIDVSVMVQNQLDQQPVLDGQVLVELQSENGVVVRAEALRGQAENDLLYAALINVPAPGRWVLEVTTSRGQDSAKIVGTIIVASAKGFWFSNWRSLALPPIVIVLFVLNQWLKKRRIFMLDP
jgi:hypothetical protein